MNTQTPNLTIDSFFERLINQYDIVRESFEREALHNIAALKKAKQECLTQIGDDENIKNAWLRRDKEPFRLAFDKIRSTTDLRCGYWISKTELGKTSIAKYCSDYDRYNLENYKPIAECYGIKHWAFEIAIRILRRKSEMRNAVIEFEQMERHRTFLSSFVREEIKIWNGNFTWPQRLPLEKAMLNGRPLILPSDKHMADIGWNNSNNSNNSQDACFLNLRIWQLFHDLTGHFGRVCSFQFDKVLTIPSKGLTSPSKGDIQLGPSRGDHFATLLIYSGSARGLYLSGDEGVFVRFGNGTSITLGSGHNAIAFLNTHFTIEPYEPFFAKGKNKNREFFQFKIGISKSGRTEYKPTAANDCPSYFLVGNEEQKYAWVQNLQEGDAEWYGDGTAICDIVCNVASMGGNIPSFDTVSETVSDDVALLNNTAIAKMVGMLGCYRFHPRWTHVGFFLDCKYNNIPLEKSHLLGLDYEIVSALEQTSFVKKIYYSPIQFVDEGKADSGRIAYIWGDVEEDLRKDTDKKINLLLLVPGHNSCSLKEKRMKRAEYEEDMDEFFNIGNVCLISFKC